MYRKTLTLYILLIGLPAIVFTLCAIGLLTGIRYRLVVAERAQAQSAANQKAYEIVQFVTEIQDNLIRQISELPQNSLPQELRTLQQTSPFIRNVFVWQSQTGIIFPSKTTTNDEERRFLFRFAPLFDGTIPWIDVQDEETSSGASSGWKPWFDGNRLHILGWKKISGENDSDASVIAGIELEMTSILARLHSVVKHRDNYSVAPLYGFELNDGQTPMLHWEISPDNLPKPIAEISLSPTLPHWTIKSYPHTRSLAQAYAYIRFAGGLIICFLAVSFFTGGWLLVRDNMRQRKDALQKTSFVSNVSHELKTPLTNVRMYAELLSEGKADTQQKTQHYLEIIVAESERLTRLVNNVLDFGRLEQNRRHYNYETVELNQWLTQIRPLLQGMVDSAGMTLNFAVSQGETPRNDVIIKIDHDALSQVVMNLVDNACKYANSGKHIDINVIHSPCAAEIHIADRGATISTKHAKRIFERFFRIDDTLTATTGGSGLGLSIARQLMRGMKGDLRWEARPNGGNKFIITLLLAT